MQVGTAWVVPPEALERFRQDAADGAAAGTDGADARTERLAHALAQGDEVTAWRVVQQALAAGTSPADCYLVLMSDALRRIGDDEESGAAEYLATATATRLVARLGGQVRRPGRSRGTVVFGAPAGEHHSLPIAVVADLVRIEGFTCLELGADVPPEAFAHAAAQAPRLVAVGIGVSLAARIDAVRATVEAVHAAAPDTPVLLGGQGVLNPDVARLAGATHWAADGAEAIRLLAELRPARPAARNRRA
jgi:methanogenic corrinoid protein MtbC1